MLTWAVQLVHWRSDAGLAAGLGKTMFCTKVLAVLILKIEQKKVGAVKTTSFLPGKFLYQTYADLTSY